MAEKLTKGELNWHNKINEMSDEINDLSNVAKTGNYEDLNNKPLSLPANGGNADKLGGVEADKYLRLNKISSLGGLPAGPLSENTWYNAPLSIHVFETSSISEMPRIAFHSGGTGRCTQIAGDHIRGGLSVLDESGQLLGIVNCGLANVGALAPTSDASVDVGGSGSRFRNIYAVTGTIQTSDERAKKDIEEFEDDKIKDFVMSLRPVQYTFKENGLRTHFGLISQDVKKSLESNGMNSLDFAGFICSPIIEEIQEKDEQGNLLFKETKTKDDKGRDLTFREPIKKKVITGESYGLRYEEFISPLIKMIQMQQKEIDELKLWRKEQESKISK